jgi:hypothetical protein
VRRDDLEKVEVHTLVHRYREAAMKHGNAIDIGDHKAASKAADVVAAIYSELRRRGTEAQDHLLALLDDTTSRIRGWAAAHALEFAPQRGEPVLRELALHSGFLGHSAQTTLKEWRAGRLRFP